MTLILELPDNKEAALKARAQKLGVSAEQYAQEILSRELGDDGAATDSGSIVDEMRALRARLKPDLEGWTTRDYVQHGRR